MGEIMQRRLISVVLPVFNAERTISTALTSVLNQTYEEFEVIIVDDGSTDSSPELLAEHAKRDQRICLIRTANHGVAAALNTGIAAARGELIARMDADDICEPMRFEKQVAHLAQHKACVAVGCVVTPIDDKGSALSVRSRLPSGVKLKDRCRNFRHFPPSPPTIPHPTAMIRSEALKAIGGYRPCLRGAEDRDLWWRLNQLGEIHRLPERLLRYRRHEASVTLTHRERTVADALLSDLSAIARHFELNDSELLMEHSTERVPSKTVHKYAHLIGERYPVERLANFRAITRGCPSLTGHRDRSSAIHYSFSQLLRNPFSRTNFRLISAALSL